MNGNRQALLIAIGEVVALQNARDAVTGAKANDVLRRERREPFAVEFDLSFLRIENLEDLSLVGFSIRGNLVACERGPRGAAPARVANHPGEIADEKNNHVAEVLKMLQLSQQDGVSQMQVRRSWIESGFHAQRRFGLTRERELVPQLFLANDLDSPFAKIFELMFEFRVRA